MDDSTRLVRRPPRAWLPDVLTAAAIVATVVLALLVAAACSSGSGPSSAGSGGAPSAGGRADSPPASARALAFAHCMRSHGVPGYPDPNSSNTMPNGLPKVGPQRLGVTTMHRCLHLTHLTGAQVPNWSG